MSDQRLVEGEIDAVNVTALRAVVEEALSCFVSRFLDSHGGAVRVGRVTADGDVDLEFLGACSSCPAAAATFYGRVLPAIRDLPLVRRVTTSKVTVSEAAIARLAKLHDKGGRKVREGRDTREAVVSIAMAAPQNGLNAKSSSAAGLGAPAD